MTKPIPDQAVFDFVQDQENPFVSEEPFETARCRMKAMNAVKEEFGYLRSQAIRGQSQRLFQNTSPILKGRKKLVTPLDLNIGNLSPTLIKV
ncbi:MAG: hypothetical protein RIQ70_1348 [Bacteroidota bacterium]